MQNLSIPNEEYIIILGNKVYNIYEQYQGIIPVDDLKYDNNMYVGYSKETLKGDIIIKNYVDKVLVAIEEMYKNYSDFLYLIITNDQIIFHFIFDPTNMKYSKTPFVTNKKYQKIHLMKEIEYKNLNNCVKEVEKFINKVLY